MTVNRPPTFSSDFVTTLAQAASIQDTGSVGDRKSAQKRRPAPNIVVHALLQAEKAAKQQRQKYPLELLQGCWRLCFTTSGKVNLQQGKVSGRGFYLPQFAPAQISFQTPASSPKEPLDIEIGNQVQLGPLLLRLTGPARYLTQKNLLAFDFTQMRLRLFNRIIYQGAFGKGKGVDFQNQPISKLPFFAFFLVTDDFIAARGRGGGLALWVREH